MAHTTQCPFCGTSFKVAGDQLKVRDGLVRCGTCLAVFNATENLILEGDLPTPPERPAFVDDHPEFQLPVAQELPDPSATPAELVQAVAPTVAMLIAPTAAPTAAPTDAPLIASFVDTSILDAAPPEPERTHDGDTHASSPLDDAPAEATPIEFDSDPEQSLHDAENIEPLEASETEGAAAHEDATTDADEPGFVQRARLAQRRQRKQNIIMGISAACLFLSLIVAAPLVFRNQLVSRFPPMKPYFVSLCKLLDLRIDLPSQIDKLAIESSELQQSATLKDTLVLTLLVRNNSKLAQAWPHLELTLKDGDEKAIARRVFRPTDYVQDVVELSKGFAPTSEQSIKLALDVNPAKPSGYALHLFYP